MESRQRASGAQFSFLLEFMESHGDLARPQPGAQGRIRSDILWQELAGSLNAIGGGVNKTPDKWKKVWADWKSKTKKKASIIRRHNAGTGGGPSNRIILTALETRVLALLGKVAVEGLSEIKEQGFDRPSLEDDVIDLVEDEMDSSLTEVVLPLLPSTGQRLLPTPVQLQHSPPRPVATPSPTTQHLAKAAISPPSSIASPRRRGASMSRRRVPDTLRMGARRKRTLTPFDRAASEFAAIEQRRLMLEEKRDTIEARRVEVEHERNVILSRFADIAEAMCQQLMQSRDRPT